MVKYFSAEFFAQLQDALANDPKWQEDTKGLKTSIKLTSTDRASPRATSSRSRRGRRPSRRPSRARRRSSRSRGPTRRGRKVAKGEVDFQSAVLKGQLKFKGSITKILFYKDRFMRIAEVIRSVPVEF